MCLLRSGRILKKFEPPAPRRHYPSRRGRKQEAGGRHMARRSDELVLRQMRALFNLGVIGELSDGQLLERFATAGGEAAELAFAALVERHGPMVLRICRNCLRDANDVEDAFQAT